MRPARWISSASIVMTLLEPACLAQCLGWHIEIWPPSGSVPRNAVWVVDYGSPYGRQTIDQLRLYGDGEPIALVVALDNTATVRQRYSIHQVVLRPARPLRPGAEYRMESHLSMPDRLVQQFGAWQVSADDDTVAPSLREEAKVEYGFRADTCGGTSRWARFDATGAEPVIAAVTMGAAGSPADPEQFLLPGRRGDRPAELRSVGPCGGGNFEFEPLADRYTGTIRLMDQAGNWSDAQPFTVDTTAEMRPLRRTNSEPAADRLPSPHRNNELFSEGQWQEAARFLGEMFAKRPFPKAFVPYDASLLDRWTFLGMPEGDVRFILGRGGQPTDLSPPQIAKYDYLMVPPPAGHHVWLKLRLGPDDKGRFVVVSEEFAPCRYEDPDSPPELDHWEQCWPSFGSSQPDSDGPHCIY